MAAYHGDELAATYRYFRSLAVESPFTTARDNLIIAFERVSNVITESSIMFSCSLFGLAFLSLCCLGRVVSYK